MTKELIEKIEDAHRRVRKIGPDAIYETELREVLRAAADALSARQPSEDDREALIDVVKRNRSVVKRMGDGYPSVAFVTDETIADAILAAGFSRATVPDARDHLHAKCDCVPDLGPAHCHLCTGEGSPVRWEDCEAVREIADVSEPVEVVLTTTDIEGLAHLLVQLSPATQKNSGATIRRLLREINIKEVGQ